jgi:hypothetical protein
VVAARRTSPFTLRLLAEVAQAAPFRAAAYGLPFSTYLAVLVWNDALQPVATLAALPRTGKIVRQPLSCSLRAPHLRIARRRARELAISVNAYLEALIAAQLARPRAPLVVFQSDRK